MDSPPPVIRRRNPDGIGDHEVQVIALSPNRLLTTYSFTCNVCYKGFMRFQNLTMHLKSHNIVEANLRLGLDINGALRRVYVCPEMTCKHHNPNQALGDITAIKRHYSRKHSNKKSWKCGTCSKLYAVEADVKAHIKKCKVEGRPSFYEYVRERENDDDDDEEEDQDQEKSNGFILPPVAYELTFDPILNDPDSDSDSDEVVKAYNEAVFSIREIQAKRLRVRETPYLPPSTPLSSDYYVPTFLSHQEMEWYF